MITLVAHVVHPLSHVYNAKGHNFNQPPLLSGPPCPQSAPLEEAEMSLKNFQASNGNVRFLEIAHSKAMTALVQGHSLDVKLSAAIIAVSAGYVHMSKVGDGRTLSSSIREPHFRGACLQAVTVIFYRLYS